MSSKPIRVAIAGFGRSGYNIHAATLRAMADRFRVVAVADQIPERREDAIREFGATVYDDWEPMIAAGGFDLFVDALPTPLHGPAAIRAFETGAHVVCEKPAARSVAGFDRMVAAAKTAGRIFAPFQNNRLQPFFDKMLEVIASGVLGNIVYIRSTWGRFQRRWDWQTRSELWGGTLLNTGPHAIDQALTLFGWERDPEVFCRMDCRNGFEGDADDHCTISLYDPARIAPQIDIVISQYIHFDQGGMYHVNGTSGGMNGDGERLRWRYYDPTSAPKQDMWHWSVDRRYPSEELDWMEEEWTHEDEKSGAVGYTLRSFMTGPVRFYDNLHGVIHGTEKPLITVDQVRKQGAVIERCIEQNPMPLKKERK